VAKERSERREVPCESVNGLVAALLSARLRTCGGREFESLRARQLSHSEAMLDRRPQMGAALAGLRPRGEAVCD